MDRKGLRPLIVSLFLLVIWSIIASLYNGVLDYSFLLYVFTGVAYYFIGIVLCSLLYKNNAKKMLTTFIVLFIVQSLFMLIHYKYNFSLLHFLVNNTTRVDIGGRIELWGQQIRLYGVGISNAQGGVLYGFALIVMAFYISRYKDVNKHIYIVSYLIIFIAGMGVARTTLIGFAISMVLMYFFQLRIAATLFAIITSIIFIIIIYFLVNNESIFLDRIIEPVLAIFDGSVTISSSDATLEMFKLPTKTSTYFFGDALWLNPTGESLYYMSIDPGFFRMIFYFGLPGVFLFFILMYRLCFFGAKRKEDKTLTYFRIFSFTYILLLSFKGIGFIPSILSFFTFILYAESLNRETNEYQN